MSHFRKLLVTRGYPIGFLDDHQTSGHLGLITSRFPASTWRKIVALCNDFGVAFGGAKSRGNSDQKSTRWSPLSYKLVYTPH